MDTKNKALVEIIGMEQTLRALGPNEAITISGTKTLEMLGVDCDILKTQASSTSPQDPFTFTREVEDEIVTYNITYIGFYRFTYKTYVRIGFSREKKGIKTPDYSIGYEIYNNEPDEVYIQINVHPEKNLYGPPYTQFAEAVVSNAVESLNICLGNSELQSETRVETRLS